MLENWSSWNYIHSGSIAIPLTVIHGTAAIIHQACLLFTVYWDDDSKNPCLVSYVNTPETEIHGLRQFHFFITPPKLLLLIWTNEKLEHPKSLRPEVVAKSFTIWSEWKGDFVQLSMTTLKWYNVKSKASSSCNTILYLSFSFYFAYRNSNGPFNYSSATLSICLTWRNQKEQHWLLCKETQQVGTHRTQLLSHCLRILWRTFSSCLQKLEMRPKNFFEWVELLFCHQGTIFE